MCKKFKKIEEGQICECSTTVIEYIIGHTVMLSELKSSRFFLWPDEYYKDKKEQRDEISDNTGSH